MENGKVLSLYMTMPDLMRSGHRMRVEDFECDEQGIVGDVNYEQEGEFLMLLTSQVTYDIIDKTEFVIDQGVLLESIHVDVDIYGLQKGTIIEIGETYFEVQGSCEDYGYIYRLAPEIPELIKGKRGLFVKPIEYGRVYVGDSVNVVKEVK
jgi:hypothetical protein